MAMEGKTRLELAFVGFADPAVTNSGALPQYWIRKMDSNHRHTESESVVLPAELFRNVMAQLTSIDLAKTGLTVLRVHLLPLVALMVAAG